METVAKRSVKKRRNQVPIGLLLLALIIIAGVLFSGVSAKIGLYWIFGITFGFVLQKSRFCFTASMRDPILTGSVTVSKAVVVAIAVATIGFAAIQYSAFLNKAEAIPGLISPAGVHTAIGGIMFGIGMVIAGGCASGTLMRVGEGFTQQLIALVFFVIGSVWGARDFGWWSTNVISKMSISDGVTKGFHFPTAFGWATAFFGQLIVLLALFIFIEWMEYRKSNAGVDKNLGA